MNRLIKIRILDFPGRQLSPVLTATYSKGLDVRLFLSFVTPANYTAGDFRIYLNTAETALDGDFIIGEDHFEQVAQMHTFLHLLLVTGNGDKSRDAMIKKLDKSSASYIAKAIEDFLSLPGDNCFETIYRHLRARKIRNTINDFFNPHVSLVSFENEKERIVVKYIDSNHIKAVEASLVVEEDEFAIKKERCPEIIFCRDIQIAQIPYDFKTIQQAIEHDGWLMVNHQDQQGAELKTFKKISFTEEEYVYQDTGNREMPMTYFHGTLGERKLTRHLVLTHRLLQNSDFNVLREIPGDVCDMVVDHDKTYWALSWDRKTKMAWITRVRPNLMPAESEMLQFGCEWHPLTFTHFKPFNIFFMAMAGKSQLYCLENSPNAQLIKVTDAFSFPEFSIPKKGEVLDLASGNFVFDTGTGVGKDHLAFLIVAQKNAVSFFYFEDISLGRNSA